jgi:hypothetical protein
MGWRQVGVSLKTACQGLAACALSLCGSVLLEAADTAAPHTRFTPAQLDFYQQQVLPILTDNCYKCHSHEADKIKANFVLDSREGLLEGGESGPAIVPGDPDKSLLMKAVRHDTEDLQMPPKRKLADEQIAILSFWITMGAPYRTTNAMSLARTRGKKITESDRTWWAYQTVRGVEVPTIPDKAWSLNPVDKFVYAKLKSSGLSPAPEADRRTLMRRTYYDVIGLPPGAGEVERFVNDQSPVAYEQMVDKLLADPRYGEKWARHWLDLLRYAESDGYKADSFRPNAWRFRDYVIRSFNQDKPYDRFLMEQLAADELWPDDPDALVGVGFLRQWIYEYNQRNVKGQWASILDDITDVTGDALLGMGLQCARCHDHKFDPILQKDYYRMQAFFAALSPRDDAPLATPEQGNQYATRLAAWELQTAAIRAEIEKLEAPVRESTTRAVLIKFPKDIQAIIAKPEVERTPYEQQIRDLAYRQVTDEGEKLESKLKGEDKQRLDELRKQLSQFDSLKPEPLPDAMLVRDIGPTAPPTVIPKDKSKTPIEPAFPTVLEETPAKIETLPRVRNSTGRRATLARWLTQPSNPLTARVFVNRVWQHHFGRGLSSTPSDFGHLGEAPSHPELLDWLVTYFVEHHWSAKQLDRLVLTSATYRQSSSATPEQAELGAHVDPENRLIWRQNLRRLDADQLRDTLLAITGELDPTAGGPSVETSKPRRTIYTKWLRNSRDPLLAVFDPPDTYISTPQRNATTTPLQSLAMINGPYVLQRARALADRIQKRNLSDPDLLTQAYRLVYSRDPRPGERDRALGFLSDQAKRIDASNTKLVPVAVQPMPGRSGTAAFFQPDSPQTRLLVPDNPLMPQNDFTIEAYVLWRGDDAAAPFRSIVSRWDGRKNQPGWSLGVAGKSSQYPAQTLALELIGDLAEEGAGGYEAISSGLRIEPGKPCYLAVSVRLGDTSETGVTFYVKELNPEANLRTAHVPHRVTATHESNLPLIIGARDPEKHVVWNGLIDDVRLSRQALNAEQLLLAHDGVNESTVGCWRFEEPDALKDSSVNGHNIRPEVSPAAQMSPTSAAFIDFCHVLLNSNELLYVD